VPRLPPALERPFSPPPVGAGDGRRLRVLVADDDVDAATSLCLLLEALGCRTEIAHDGPQCLRKSAGFAPHLSFIDLEMPGMSGVQVVRELKKDTLASHGRLICLTGHDQPEDRRLCLAAGFDALVVKPMPFDTLASAVADLRDA
jgi:CheY-like chemotaxis protein